MNGEELLRIYDSILSGLARRIAKRYHADWLVEDLKQEGAIALLSAAKQYAPDSGADLLACAAGAVRNAMLDYAAENFLPLCIPPKRIRVLRKVAVICAESDDPVSGIQNALSVSARVALALYEEYRTFFFPAMLDESVYTSVSPERVYERKLLSQHLDLLTETELTARERSILTLHLGLGGNDPKTFTELSALLNYNDPSAVQKVFNRAIAKLRCSMNTGEYGAWIAAKAAVRAARNGMV